MNFRQFAFKNVFRNKRLYVGYFISCAFSVMIFFVYSMLAFHPELNLINEATGGYGRGSQAGMKAAQYIIYVFSFFFILYSMSVFLKTRKKEFGICMMQGMSDIQLKRLVFLENMVIGFASTVSGILTGLLTSKGMLALCSSILHLDHPLSFYFPTTALSFTFVAFILLFVIISFFTATILRTSLLIDLLKASMKPKMEPKASVWLALVAAVLLALGYAVVFRVEKFKDAIEAFLPVIILISIGTYFLFTQLSVYIIHKLKRNKKLYHRNTNMLTLSDLAYRMKDNARMFFLVTIISTVAFTAIGALAGFKAQLATWASSVPPLSYWSYTDNKQEQVHIALIEQTLAKENVQYEPIVFQRKKAVLEGKSSFNTIPASSYNSLRKEKININKGKAILLQLQQSTTHDDGDNEKTAKWTKGRTLILRNGTRIQLNEVSNMSEDVQRYCSASGQLLVMADEDFKVLPKSDSDVTIFIYNIRDWPSTKVLSAQLNNQLQTGSSDRHYRFEARTIIQDEDNQTMGQILLIGLFVSTVFFVAAGSFLYFRLFSDLDNDIIQYRAISKLGLTEEELSKVVSTQIGLLFFVPIIVAIIHGAVALNTLQNLLRQSFLKEMFFVLGSFLMVQVVYFLFIRASYVKKLKKVLSSAL